MSRHVRWQLRSGFTSSRAREGTPVKRTPGSSSFKLWIKKDHFELLASSKRQKKRCREVLRTLNGDPHNAESNAIKAEVSPSITISGYAYDAGRTSLGETPSAETYL